MQKYYDIYLGASMMLAMFNFVIWSSKDGPNLAMKTFFFLMMVAGIVLTTARILQVA